MCPKHNIAVSFARADDGTGGLMFIHAHTVQSVMLLHITCRVNCFIIFPLCILCMLCVCFVLCCVA